MHYLCDNKKNPLNLKKWMSPHQGTFPCVLRSVQLTSTNLFTNSPYIFFRGTAGIIGTDSGFGTKWFSLVQLGSEPRDLIILDTPIFPRDSCARPDGTLSPCPQAQRVSLLLCLEEIGWQILGRWYSMLPVGIRA